ncbi:hypothetical protein F0P96_03535 [Hymenobacter busanensis]|uniref:Uncharacterized protein n=1 Tax=Hymenobacter busanensis TaxID=2607656 RepID=A0A7L4ZUQ5_9BACT|nr:hypothetical protein [Hymenobacter busanensis]KAA9339700.1 hypothetical protein F0P96_03535 [Hymenobacter busanensis]QHJ06545.1 hypothetical protein GUY19_04215 [Hymenobacter busanensis]
MESNKINTPIDPKQIKGWGIDADPKNDPTYPMRQPRMNITQDPDYKHRPESLQPVDTEVLRSVERPNVSAVFGTPEPPKGLSGLIRRAAFHFSENEYAHWLPLLLADRVDVVEGVLDDLVHGKLPNIYAEKGYPVEWKHNRTSLILKLTTVAAVATGALVLLSSNGKKSKKRKGYRSAYYDDQA